jgi:hypothetical protein
MSLMNDLQQYVLMKQADSAQQNQGFSQLGQMLGQAAKEREDEKRRQENVKKQMANAQQMMQQMSQMDDNSSVGRANVALDDEQQKRNRGVIKVSTMLPQREMSIDENGALNIKIGTRQATPAEQKAQFEMQKEQMDLEREAGKRSLLSGYIKGELQEGAVIQGMQEFNITPDEFNVAVSERERMRQISGLISQQQQIPQGFEATEMTRDPMGSLIPSGIKKVQPPMSMAQPTAMDGLREEQARLNIEKTKRELAPQPIMQQTQSEAPFRFKTDKSVAEQKFEAEKMESDKKAQLEGDMVKESAQDTLDTIAEIENGIKYFGAMGNLPALPAEYPKQNWQANLDKLQSKLVVDLMNRMKQASRTGATGFGALSEKELKVLQNAATALKKGMSEEDAQKYLNEIKTKAQKVLGGQEQGQVQSDQGVSVPSVGGSFNGEKVISVKRIR